MTTCIRLGGPIRARSHAKPGGSRKTPTRSQNRRFPSGHPRIDEKEIQVIMADKNDKVAGQPDGKYYVDAQCIDCDLCRETAPDNFTRNDEEGFSYVSKQPESPEEEALCKEAMANCAVEAIGDDGI